MVVSRQKIFDSAIDGQKIAPDTIVPADIDETQAYNFSSTGSTLAGILSGTISGVNQPTAMNLSSNNGTFSGVWFKAGGYGIQMGQRNVSNASTAMGYPKGNFAAAPTVVISKVSASGSTATWIIEVVSTSASSMTVTSDTAGTISFIASYYG